MDYYVGLNGSLRTVSDCVIDTGGKLVFERLVACEIEDSLKHMLMSDIEIIANGDRLHRWSAADKLRFVRETMYDGESISAVARRNGVAPNLLYRWRKLTLEGGSIVVAEDDSVIGDKTVREMDNCLVIFHGCPLPGTYGKSRIGGVEGRWEDERAGEAVRSESEPDQAIERPTYRLLDGVTELETHL